MGLLLLSAVLTFTILGGAAFVFFNLVIKRLVKKTDRNKFNTALLIIVAITSSIAWMPVAGLLHDATVVTGENVPAHQFRGIGPRLPVDAKNITFHSSFIGVDAIFQIDEPGFMRWVSSANWNVVEIDAPKEIDFFRIDTSSKVEDGLLVTEVIQARGTGVQIIFDRSSQRCFYHYSSR